MGEMTLLKNNLWYQKCELAQQKVFMEVVKEYKVRKRVITEREIIWVRLQTGDVLKERGYG